MNKQTKIGLEITLSDFKIRLNQRDGDMLYTSIDINANKVQIG